MCLRNSEGNILPKGEEKEDPEELVTPVQVGGRILRERLGYDNIDPLILFYYR